MTDHEALEPCRKCGAVCRVEDFNGSTVWMCSQHKWFGGNCPSETAYLTDAAWNTRARPSDEQLDDDLNDILAPFHWEAWKAALFDSCPDGWPDDDEQEIICRRVDSMAVGEHYEAWSAEVREKIKALSAIPADPVVEQMAQALEEIIEATKYADGRAWDANTIARRALANYRKGTGREG